jgi:putative peptidoglycan lipid II flippase
LWARGRIDWVHAVDVWRRIAMLILIVGGAVVVYFGVLLLAGVQLRQFVRK